MTRRFIMFLTLVLAFGASVFAQQPSKPISWRLNARMISATEGELILTATIADGWHLYGTSLPEGGPAPTSINFSGSTGVKLIGSLVPSPAPKSYVDDIFSMRLTSWHGKVTFRQKFKVSDPNAANIKAVVKYMGCNGTTCMAPKTETLTRKVVVKK